MNPKLTLLALSVFAAGCGGKEYPQPKPDRAQLLVKLAARAKEGVKGPKGDSGDGYSSAGMSPERAKCYERVDYDDLEDIAVLLKGSSLGDGGPAPTSARLTISNDGPDHRLVLLGPKKHTQLTLRNSMKVTLTLGCMGPSGDGFLTSVPPGQEGVVTLSDPGIYELNCDEDECLHVTLVVAPTTWAALGKSGDEVFFDGVVPGEIDVVIQAPRLPDVSRRVSATAGIRATVDAEVSVNRMEESK
ncbi:MAG: hypothetical protein FD180_3396 [Planctomycetota bacterium]|nr:MAG: hypothetical protein FD180_3396 [Planctomycetota bacterium]